MRGGILSIAALEAVEPGGVEGPQSSSFGAIIGSRRECSPAIMLPFLGVIVLVIIMIGVEEQRVAVEW